MPQDLMTVPANLVLEGAVERKHLAHYYADQAIGVMIIRGENVVLLGEIVRGHSVSLGQINTFTRIWMLKMKSLFSRSHWRSWTQPSNGRWTSGRREKRTSPRFSLRVLVSARRGARVMAIDAKVDSVRIGVSPHFQRSDCSIDMCPSALC